MSKSLPENRWRVLNPVFEYTLVLVELCLFRIFDVFIQGKLRYLFKSYVWDEVLIVSIKTDLFDFFHAWLHVVSENKQTGVCSFLVVLEEFP